MAEGKAADSNVDPIDAISRRLDDLISSFSMFPSTANGDPEPLAEKETADSNVPPIAAISRRLNDLISSLPLIQPTANVAPDLPADKEDGWRSDRGGSRTKATEEDGVESGLLVDFNNNSSGFDSGLLHHVSGQSSGIRAKNASEVPETVDPDKTVAKTAACGGKPSRAQVSTLKTRQPAASKVKAGQLAKPCNEKEARPSSMAKKAAVCPPFVKSKTLPRLGKASARATGAVAASAGQPPKTKVGRSNSNSTLVKTKPRTQTQPAGPTKLEIVLSQKPAPVVKKSTASGSDKAVGAKEQKKEVVGAKTASGRIGSAQSKAASVPEKASTSSKSKPESRKKNKWAYVRSKIQSFRPVEKPADSSAKASCPAKKQETEQLPVVNSVPVAN